MSETVNDLTENQIGSLVEKYPLPEGVPDAVMTREELADALAVSLPTVSDWISRGMPVKERGGQGKPYELVFSHCWAWRQAWKAQEDLRSDQVKKAQAAMRLALIGGASGDSIEALDPKTRREIIAVQITQEQFARERNQLLQRDDVANTFDELLSMVRDVLESAPDRVERREAIPANGVTALVEICDELIDEMRRKIEAYFSARPLRAENRKSDLFDA